MAPPQGNGGRSASAHRIPPGTEDGAAVINEGNNHGHNVGRDLAWAEIHRRIANVDLNISFRDRQPTVRPPDHPPRCFGGNRYAHRAPLPWVYKAQQNK
ncbi:hypothetical protein AAVH_05213 [Aphelenchoides avenae]|nr:hypothetical protein AAVH_05213 [Aphelenchus avenae]